MKVLISIDDCKKCTFSTNLTTNTIDYTVLVCDKTRTILAVTDKEAIYNTPIEIPASCPLPDSPADNK